MSQRLSEVIALFHKSDSPLQQHEVLDDRLADLLVHQELRLRVLEGRTTILTSAELQTLSALGFEHLGAKIRNLQASQRLRNDATVKMVTTAQRDASARIPMSRR